VSRPIENTFFVQKSGANHGADYRLAIGRFGSIPTSEAIVGSAELSSL
jgi:hypothetical protein